MVMRAAASVNSLLAMLIPLLPPVTKNSGADASVEIDRYAALNRVALSTLNGSFNNTGFARLLAALDDDATSVPLAAQTNAD